QASAIFWDKLPIANKAGWECAHILCCHVMLGGKVMVGSGDFRQVTPIVPGSGKMATLAASMKTSFL
ncbi:hypothetical protein L210DRAFT_835351, partial [Boletus edulis BED1]